uniref:Uncharacterized protein n=1 Tax=Pyxicephalus adspersus TaxID=30357 RepID=A0AAV3AB93_PYXAD|nr:TPA: hypothetical protein GDO54_011846 [Pyxicephalus adspersus]
MRTQYGDVFSLNIFFENAVVINGYDAVKEALVTKSEDTSDRPSIPMFDHAGLSNGIAFSRYGQHWKAQRRFALYTLRNFGMGKKTIEERVREEAGYLCSAFQDQEGHPFDPYMVLNNAVSNVICSIIFGDRFDYTDASFQRMLHLLRESFELESKPITQFYKLFPWLMKVPGPHQKLFQVVRTYLDFLEDIIQKHRETWDPSIRRDFIDVFFEEMEKNNENPNSTFNEKTLLSIIADLFVAGTDTTSNTLRWSLLMMLHHPHIQGIICRDIGPVFLKLSKAGEDTLSSVKLGDPANLELIWGTTIIPNLTSVLKDGTIWKKPHQFYPEHFLDSDGKFMKREAFIPFSAGRRICVGEQLARMDLFIFFTSLLQRFEFRIPDKQPPPRQDPLFMFNFSPYPFQICLQVR